MRKNIIAVSIALFLAVSGVYAQSNSAAEVNAVNRFDSTSKGDAGSVTSDARHRTAIDRSKTSESPVVRSVYQSYVKEQNQHQTKHQRQARRQQQADHRQQVQHQQTTQNLKQARLQRHAWRGPWCGRPARIAHGLIERCVHDTVIELFVLDKLELRG